MKVVVSKIKFYGIFLWRKTNSPPEYIENLLSVSVDIAIRLNTWFWNNCCGCSQNES